MSLIGAEPRNSLVGFRDVGGHLKEIKNSTTFLTATTTGGASLSFSPDGQILLVTERIANNIDAFHVRPDGTLSPIVVNANPAPGTFSVRFAPDGAAIVSETGPANENSGSAISSYRGNSNGSLTAISQSVQPSVPATVGMQLRLMGLRSTPRTPAATISQVSTSGRMEHSLPSVEQS